MRLKSFVLMLCVSASFILNASEQQDNFSSVVKVFAVFSNPNFYQPWQNFQQQINTGSGCIIEGNKILTNAHIVSNQTFIMIRKQGDAKKYTAKLLASGHDCDLSLLTVEDPKFFEGTKPMAIGELPRLQDKVAVLGYPVGGDNISVTEGVVSRIEPTVYTHSGRFLLSVQIDAAINPGNSGGPVIKDGKLAGLAFQNAAQRENMGYIIPTTVIRHFLKDVEDKEYNGFPDIDVKISEMENPDIRKWAGMKDGQTGVLITRLPPLEKDKNIFLENDVILEIDGIKVANDGTVPFRENEIMFFGNLIWEKYIGDTSKFKVLRKGEEVDLSYKLSRLEKLVPQRFFDKYPSFYVIGGLLFVPLTQNYIDSWGSPWWNKAPRELVNYAFDGEISSKRKQVIILSEVFADDINVGYQSIKFQPVTKLNGKAPVDMKDLIDTIENTKEGFIDLELAKHIKVVLDVTKMRNANPEILKRYRIPADRSADMK